MADPIYALVADKSLAGFGIQEGDYVILDKGSRIEEGSLYLVSIGEEMSICYLSLSGDKLDCQFEDGSTRTYKVDEV